MTQSFAHNASFLKIAYEYISEAVMVADDEQVITYLNPSAENLFLVAPGEIHGQKLLDVLILLDAEGKKMTARVFKTLLAGKDEQGGSAFLKLKNKTSIAVNFFIKTLKTVPGEKAGFFLKFSESSKKVDLIHNLRESERKYRRLFENALEGIFILDNDGAIVDYNPTACEIYQRKDFEGMSVFDLLPQNKPTENKKYWKELFEKGAVSGYYKYTFPDGHNTYVDYKAKANYQPNLHLVVFSDVTEKRLTEKALLSSEANLKAIFDSSEQSIILLDTKLTIVAMNVKAVRWAKEILHKQLLIGSNMLDYIINKDTFKAEAGRAMKGEKVVVERNIIGSSGEDNWGEFSYIPIKNNKGNIVSICYTTTSINSRKHEALVLAESEQKFRSLSENSPDIIYIIDLEKRVITYFNRPQLFGYPSSALTRSEGWIELVHPDDFKRVVEHWSVFVSPEYKQDGALEYRVKRKDGAYEWVSNRHIVIERNKDGIPSKVLLNITIITERIKAQEALKESEAKLKALIENTTDPLWSIDAAFNLTAANTAFYELIKTNYKKKIKIGDNLLYLLPDVGEEAWISLHQTALKGGHISAEYSWQTKNRKKLFYEISYNPIFDSNNNVAGVSVFARDITQRKTNEATILQTNFELDSFVYRASHDLRAPLRSILGLVNIINTQKEQANSANYLKLIEKSAIKLDNFISDLINFSRNSRAIVDVEEIDFGFILAECRENIRFMENADQVTFLSEVEENKKFYSDAKRISILFNNLLSNAIKYQDPNKKQVASFVKICIRTNAKEAVITIEDNGVGIKKEYLPKIFNMFFRASEKSFGSGLGLYIVRQIVDRLGGDIKVESKLGIGTTFTVVLPNLKQNN
jgi:PAS domain S-box-containing protein